MDERERWIEEQRCKRLTPNVGVHITSADYAQDLRNAMSVADRQHGERVSDIEATICCEILSIMRTYHEQASTPFGIDTPGGLEHMGDVWKLFHRWENMLITQPGPLRTPKE